MSAEVFLPSREEVTGAAKAQGEGVLAAPGPLVVGLDLSLTSTGIAHLTPRGLVTDLVVARGTGILRLRRLAHAIRELTSSVQLVVMEGPSYGSIGAGFHERAGLHWLVVDRLWRHGIPLAICPPTSLKAYATGRGNASKDEVLAAAIRRLPGFTASDNNEADAAWLAAIGLDHLTGIRHVNDAQHARLKGMVWPTVTRQVLP